jgi:hypothetical protein
MTVEEMIAQIKVLLDEPNTEHPSKRQIMINLSSNLQQYHNELQLTGAPWNIQTWQLDTVPGTSEYQVMAQNWGKPMLVLSKTTEPQGVEEEVQISNIENFDFPHSTPTIAFYGKGALSHGLFCRIVPEPSQAKSYTIWYKGGPIPFVSLTDELTMPEHHHLIIHRTAVACLPYCRWYDFEKEFWGVKMAGLQQALQYSLQGYEDSFGRYKNNQKSEQMRARVLWGNDG